MFLQGTMKGFASEVGLAVKMAVSLMLVVGPAGLYGQTKGRPGRWDVPRGLVEHSIRVTPGSGSPQQPSTERWFLVTAGTGPKTPAPVVVLLHGGHQSMRKIFGAAAGGTRAWLDLAETEGFLLLVPNGTNAATGDAKGDEQQWNDVRPGITAGDDIAFLGQLLDWTAKHYQVDPKRVFVTGASNGGMMTFRVLMAMPERFAAGAAFIANLPVQSPNVKVPSRPAPVMIANGTKDPLIRWDGGAIPGQNDRLRPTPQTVAWWVEANRARREPRARQTLPDRDPSDGCRIHLDEYPAGEQPSAPVLFYTMEGGGHTMPSLKYRHPDLPGIRRLIGPTCRDAEGADLAWQFFRRFGR